MENKEDYKIIDGTVTRIRQKMIKDFEQAIEAFEVAKNKTGKARNEEELLGIDMKLNQALVGIRSANG